MDLLIPIRLKLQARMLPEYLRLWSSLLRANTLNIDVHTVKPRTRFLPAHSPTTPTPGFLHLFHHPTVKAEITQRYSVHPDRSNSSPESHRSFISDPSGAYTSCPSSQEPEPPNRPDGRFLIDASYGVQHRMGKLTQCLQTFLIALSNWQLQA